MNPRESFEELKRFISTKTPFEITDVTMNRSTDDTTTIDLRLVLNRRALIESTVEKTKMDVLVEMLRTGAIDTDEIRRQLGISQKELEAIDPVLAAFPSAREPKKKRAKYEADFKELLKDL